MSQRAPIDGALARNELIGPAVPDDGFAAAIAERRQVGVISADDDPELLHREAARIRAIAIPPAWTDVWISPDPNSHLLATGRDARGRKVYRYHRRFRAVMDEAKFSRLVLITEKDKSILSLEAQLDCLGGVTDAVIRQYLNRFDEEAKKFAKFAK